MKCKPLNLPHVAPGWGCCQCKGYNGMQRGTCKGCGHERCDMAPTTTTDQVSTCKSVDDKSLN